ncbi:melatonin receptor type 1A-like [Protopterus annectens]|uniref:melatonin receptor type 1A-like n=1 Tax=Protopterus annectens TaxID=7888 RepID=UPI001CF9654C|nr:melatonin receptor type 1A-like [Protopterus annectens]
MYKSPSHEEEVEVPKENDVWLNAEGFYTSQHVTKMSVMNTSCDDCWIQGTNYSYRLTKQTSAMEMYLLVTVLSFTIVTDIIGNGLVIFSVLRSKKLRNPGNVFVISLSVADLLAALYPYPAFLTAIVSDAWILGDMHCKLSGIVLSMGVIGSVYSITAIAVNRYCCICHSSRYDKLYSMKKTYCYFGILWLVTIIVLLPIIFVDALQYDPLIYSCTFIQSVNASCAMSVAFIHFIIPVSLVIFCYSSIWILLIQVKYRVRQESKQKLKPSEIRSFLTMFAVFVIFLICWGPFSVNSLILGFSPPGKAPEIPNSLYVLSYFIAYFNSCLSGIIYGIMNKNFRQEYKKIFTLLCVPVLKCKKTS